MAEKGAHLITSNLEKPSIFEVVAADSLHSTFRPAFKRIVFYLGNRNPEKYGFLVKYYDEIFLLFNGVIQNYYLTKYGGSLSEVFYGLSRYSLKAPTFRSKDKFASLFCLVALPYLLEKLEVKIQKWKDDIYENVPDNRTKYKEVALNSYRTIKTMYELSKIVQYIFYLANLSQTHSVKLKLFELSLKYLPPQEEDPFSWKDFLTGKLKYSSLVSGVVFRGLELGGFFIQFLQWWQSEATQADITSLPTPDAPDLDVNANKYKNICPLCFQYFEIPTVVTVSG